VELSPIRTGRSRSVKGCRDNLSPPQPHAWRHTLGGNSVRDWPPPPFMCWSTACTHACVSGVNTSGEPLVGTRNVAQVSLHQLITTFLHKIVILSGNYLLPLAVGSLINVSHSPNLRQTRRGTDGEGQTVVVRWSIDPLKCYVFRHGCTIFRYASILTAIHNKRLQD
jgi:hypothetical protein